MVRRVGQQFSVDTFVNGVADMWHGNVLIDADDLVFGTIRWPPLTQPQPKVQKSVDA